MSRVYIAGKYQDPLVQFIANDIETCGFGHEIALKWWERDVPKPYLDHIHANAWTAKEMIDAVHESNVLVLVVNDDLYGAMVEFGAALARGIPVILTAGPSVDPRQSVFFCHPQVRIVQPLYIAEHVTRLIPRKIATP